MNAERKEHLITSVKFHPGAGNMNSGSSRYRSSLVREDAYFSELDQILLSNLRVTLELQADASACIAGGHNEFGTSYFERNYATAEQSSWAR